MGEAAIQRKKRLKQLCNLAKAYRHIDQETLARQLGRHVDRLVPDGGNPTLDYLLGLAGIIDWPVSTIVSFLGGLDAEPAAVPAEAPGDFQSLEAASRQAHTEGHFEAALALARRSFALAHTPDERVIACIREASACDGLGKFTDALEAEQRGLMESPVSGDIRRQLEVNLANAYYTLWALPEAESVALKLIAWYRENAPSSDKDRMNHAFAHYVLGSTLREAIALDPKHAVFDAERASAALITSRHLYEQIGGELQESRFDGIVRTINGALIQIEVMLGRRGALDALQEIEQGLEAVIDPESGPAGDWLESYGWWCIFGCSIAQQNLSDERLLQQYMAKFTDKADVIARRLGNWALRERVFSMEYASYERVERLTGRPALLTLDDEDLEALVGVVGRFPKFGATGLKLFDAHAASLRAAI